MKNLNYKGRYLLVSLFILSLSSFLQSQSVKLIPDPGFVPYATYYISGIDLSTGTTDIMLFSYVHREERNNYETPNVWAQIEFEMTMVSPALGIRSPETVIKLESNSFQMFADLRLDNRELSTQTTFLYDLDSPPNEIPVSVDITESIDMGKFESLLASITSTGKLAEGQYSFHVIVNSGPSRNDLSLSDEVIESIIVTTPTSLNLIAPGGALEDTSQNLVYSPYPIFQWETEPCPGCESFIRVSEFDSRSHSSLEEAVEDITTLPMDQTQGWAPVGITTTFQYPFTGAIELIPGRAYVWQIRKQLPTTVGTESFLSPIYSFKIADLSQPAEMGSEVFHPVLQQLTDLLGEEQFNAFFGPEGSLAGYDPSGVYIINGMEVSVDAVFSLINQIRNQSITITDISVE